MRRLPLKRQAAATPTRQRLPYNEARGNGPQAQAVTPREERQPVVAETEHRDLPLGAKPAVDAAPSFGERLWRLRLAAGLTQEDLAERAGVSARSISDFERGLPHR